MNTSDAGLLARSEKTPLNTDSRDTIAKSNRLLATKTVRLEKEDLNIRYAELGDPGKPTVLLLHGVPENLQAWYAVAPLLAEKYHVLAVDWPGFGGSDPLTSPGDYTSRRFAEVIVDFMDSLQIRQANLVATDIALLPSLLVGLEGFISRLSTFEFLEFQPTRFSAVSPPPLVYARHGHLAALLFERRVVSVAFRTTAIVGRRVAPIQVGPESKPLGKIRTRDKLPPKCNQIRLTVSHPFLGLVKIEPAGYDQRAFVLVADQSHHRLRFRIVPGSVLIFGEARPYDVEIGEVIVVEPLDDVAKRGFRIIVGHVVKSAEG